MKLIDEIRTGARLIPTWKGDPNRSLQDCLRRAIDGNIPIILAENVDDFVSLDESAYLTRRGSWGKSIPNAIPPFNQMWLEWSPKTHFNGKVRRVATFVEAAQAKQGSGKEGWRLSLVTMYSSSEKGVIGLNGRRHLVYVNAVGTVTNIEYEEHSGEPLADDEEPESAAALTLYSTLVALLTICFMNCRNVTVSWLPTPEKLARSFKKKHGRWPARQCGTVFITPMTRLICASTRGVKGDADDAHTERREIMGHICRGHLKTYSEGAKLFGKTSGTFFWQDHVRGLGVPEDREYRINTKGIGARAGATA